jgi:hypothetical protein
MGVVQLCVEGASGAKSNEAQFSHSGLLVMGPCHEKEETKRRAAKRGGSMRRAEYYKAAAMWM